jgi:E3 ubiquitin-protein ligase HUWE1
MPNLLDFESKRDYFNKEIEKQRQAARNRGGRLNIRVNRGNIFQGAYQELNYRSAAELKSKIKVTFEGEAGIDASGLTREFYTELSRAMFNPDYSLFIMTSNGVSFYANSESYINPDHLNFFKFVGRMVGKAIFDGQLLECYFARSLYKMMIGEELYFEDLSDMDNDCYRNFRWYIDNDVSDLCQYFAITRDYFGRPEEIPLKEGGSNLAVTNDNKTEYIELFTIYKMYISVKEQVDAFLGGFHEIVSRDLISIFNAKELELLISGLPNFDVADLKANTQLRGYTMDSPQIIWLFEMLETFDKHE